MELYNWRGIYRGKSKGFEELSDPGWLAKLLFVSKAFVECHSVSLTMAGEHDEKLA